MFLCNPLLDLHLYYTHHSNRGMHWEHYVVDHVHPASLQRVAPLFVLDHGGLVVFLVFFFGGKIASSVSQTL